MSLSCNDCIMINRDYQNDILIGSGVFVFKCASRGAKCRDPQRTCGRADEDKPLEAFAGETVRIVFWERRANLMSHFINVHDICCPYVMFSSQ